MAKVTPNPSAATATAAVGDAPRRRNIAPSVAAWRDGVRVELDGGGWIRVIATRGNVGIMRKRDRLEEEARARLGYTLEQPLPLDVVTTISWRMLVGEALLEWGDFFNGHVELPCRRLPNGDLDEESEEAGFLLLSLGPERALIDRELLRLNALAKVNDEGAAKN